MLMEEESYFCTECGNEQDSMVRACDSCGSARVSTYHVWGMREAAREADTAAGYDLATTVSRLREAVEHIALEFERINKSKAADS